MSKSTFQQKTKLMAKLFDSGCNTEKKLQQLDMESMERMSSQEHKEKIKSKEKIR